MLTNNDAAKVYETILSIPGMSETVKMDFKMSRKNVLLLHAIIERGLSGKTEGQTGGILEVVNKEMQQEFAAFSNDCLQKAGLTDFYEKLKSLSSQKS